MLLPLFPLPSYEQWSKRNEGDSAADDNGDNGDGATDDDVDEDGNGNGATDDDVDGDCATDDDDSDDNDGDDSNDGAEMQGHWQRLPSEEEEVRASHPPGNEERTRGGSQQTEEGRSQQGLMTTKGLAGDGSGRRQEGK